MELSSGGSDVFKWSWSFKSSPEALWPHVADTDCFNEAVGLGPVDVELARESPDTTARVGHAHAVGLEMRWREYPFEWIRNREHTVFRWYREGPLEALWNRVELRKRECGGTDLTHEIATSRAACSDASQRSSKSDSVFAARWTACTDTSTK